MKLEKEIIDNIYNKKKEMRNLINKKNRRFLNETYEEKSREMMEKLNFRPGQSFDYVEEERIYEIEVHEGETCEQCGKELNEGETCECGMKEETIYEVEVDEEMEEGNLFGKAVRDAKKRGDDEFTVGGKKYPVKESNYYSFDFKNKSYLLNENEFAKFVNRLVENKNSKTKILYRVKTDLGTHLFTEEKMMDIIEDIVLKEEKNFSKGKIPKGYSEYEKSVKKSKKENDDYITSVSKKMKDYLKDGSKGTYEMNPKMFPQGNGELAKMDKKAFKMTDELEDFNYEIAGQNFPVPDAIDYNEEWMEKLFKGDSMTGNAPGGNALAAFSVAATTSAFCSANLDAKASSNCFKFSILLDFVNY